MGVFTNNITRISICCFTNFHILYLYFNPKTTYKKTFFLFGFANSLALANRLNFLVIFTFSIIYIYIYIIKNKATNKITALLIFFALGLSSIIIPFKFRGYYFNYATKSYNPFNYIKPGIVTNPWSYEPGFERDFFLYDNPKERFNLLRKGGVINILKAHYYDIKNWYGAYEIPCNIDFYQFVRHSNILHLMILNFAFINLLSIFSIFYFFKRKQSLLFFIITSSFLLSISFIVTIPNSRYRLPIFATDCILGAIGLYYFFINLIQHKTKIITLLLIISIVYLYLFSDIKKYQNDQKILGLHIYTLKYLLKIIE